jgi:hypothetical protein
MRGVREHARLSLRRAVMPSPMSLLARFVQSVSQQLWLSWQILVLWPSDPTIDTRRCARVPQCQLSITLPTAGRRAHIRSFRRGSGCVGCLTYTRGYAALLCVSHRSLTRTTVSDARARGPCLRQSAVLASSRGLRRTTWLGRRGGQSHPASKCPFSALQEQMLRVDATCFRRALTRRSEPKLT